MHSAARQDGIDRPRALSRPGRFAAAWLALLLLCQAFFAPGLAFGATPAITNFELTRNDEGVFLTYAVDLELTRSVDDALSKAVPLYFVAETEVYRSRFYWRDQRVGREVRVWRIVYQPLSSNYRVTFLGLSQNYATKEEALAAISRGARWKIAEAGQIEEGSRQYVEFNYRLDTSLLPRPMQIGVGGQAEWTIAVQRSQKIE